MWTAFTLVTFWTLGTGFTSKALFTLRATFTLVTFWTGDALRTLWTNFAAFTFFTVFNGTFSDWFLAGVSRTIWLGWVELNGGFFLRFIASYDWNEGFTISTFFTLGTGCAGSTSCACFALVAFLTLGAVFTIFNDTSCNRVLSGVSRTISFGWVELNGGFFLRFIAVNDWNIGLAIFALGTLSALFTLRFLWSGYTWITFFTLGTLGP
ncbi:hypothetical protein [Aerococcus urinae]|uniref:hypothetical protein n=1 Tax=Aerococcus urinae TaxID=1376 RepID=UPI001E3DE0AF|nr:hypothetical protein [Aerococcus urinae]